MTTIEVSKDSAAALLCQICHADEGKYLTVLPVCSECGLKRALEEFDRMTIRVKG